MADPIVDKKLRKNKTGRGEESKPTRTRDPWLLGGKPEGPSRVESRNRRSSLQASDGISREHKGPKVDRRGENRKEGQGKGKLQKVLEGRGHRLGAVVRVLSFQGWHSLGETGSIGLYI